MNKLIATIAVLSTISLLPLAQADNHDKRLFTATDINDTLTLLQGKGGNIVLSKGSDGLLIVDDDYAEMSDALKKEIKKHGGVKKLKFILNTHWHDDHTGNNATFGKRANIIAHENVRKRLATRQEIPLFNKVTKPQPQHALPDLTFPKSMNIHFNGDTIKLEHYPNGHTDGDTVVFFKNANVVHMGDHMFNPMFPFIDIGSGGNALSYADNVSRIIKKINNNTVVIPGHGPQTNKRGLIRYHTMLTSTIAEVSAMKSSGMTLEQIQTEGFSAQWKEWSDGFINESTWISFIFESL